MESQTKRPGGTVCINNPGAWKSFDGVIGELEPCPLPSGDAPTPNMKPEQIIQNENQTNNVKKTKKVKKTRKVKKSKKMKKSKVKLNI